MNYRHTRDIDQKGQRTHRKPTLEIACSLWHGGPSRKGTGVCTTKQSGYNQRHAIEADVDTQKGKRKTQNWRTENETHTDTVEEPENTVCT
jgi:hypothetical protein